MTKTHRPERQKHTRIQFDANVTIYPVTSSKSGNVLEMPAEGIQVKGRDISEGGIRLELGNAPTEFLRVNFNIQKYKSVDAFAKLVWKNGQTCGFQYIFLDTDSRMQIRNYVDKQTQK